MSTMHERLDAIVIGSGFGGAFAIDHLVNAGLRVALVERGPWRDTAPVRAAGITQRSPLPHGRHAFTHLVRRVSAPFLPARGIAPHAHGLFDLHLDRDMSVVCSSGVGGGSHVYTAMNTPPAVDHYWDNRADGIDAAAMRAHCDAAIARMGARVTPTGGRIPNATADRYANHPLFSAGADQPAMSYDYARDAHRDNAIFGCADGSKTTLDALLVAPAMQRGLTVLDLHEALAIGPDNNGGWRVTLRDHRGGGYRHLAAPRLLLAAGTLNTLRLLFESRARGALGAMSALGLGFGGNGDSIGYWACNEHDADYSLGAPCHGHFVPRGVPAAAPLMSVGLNGIDALPLPAALRRRLKRDLVLVGMGADEANGFASCRDGRLRFHYPAAANPVLARMRAAFADVARVSGKPVHTLARFPVTVHPLGGARVDDNPARGVIDGRGQAHGLPGLYIVDASALPAAPGSPPSMSIATWATHVAHGIARRG